MRIIKNLLIILCVICLNMGFSGCDNPEPEYIVEPTPEPTPEPEPKPVLSKMIQLPFDQSDLKGEYHCDIVFGYAFSSDLLLFVKPVITITIEGCDPYEFELSDENIIDEINTINYKSQIINLNNNAVKYCWAGIQRKGLTAEGSIEVKYVKKDVDYSDFSSDLILISHPFVCLSTVKANSSKISISNIILVNVMVGKRDYEREIDNIINSSKNIVKF